MSNDDDIERLLREVDNLTSSTSQPPATRPAAEVEKTSGGGSEAMILVISAVIGIAGLLLGLLPFVNGMWMGIGGFLGAFIGMNIARRLS